MSQRDSGYERKERDLYETPEWVTESLLPHLAPQPMRIWEPACGSGKISKVLANALHLVTSTDVYEGGTRLDFLAASELLEPPTDAIVTNPPYDLATEFIEHAIKLLQPETGIVAMLLRTDFDHAKSRRHLFGSCAQFAKKIVLTKRIRWFEDSKGQPSFNHAWFIWDWAHEGAPTLAYSP